MLLLLDDSVEIAAISDVDDELAKLRAIDADLRSGEVRGDVEQPHLVDEAAVALILGDDAAGGRVERDLPPPARRDETVLEPHRYRTDRAVATHRQAARYLDEEDRGVAIVAQRRVEERARHDVVAARLEHQGMADPVEAGEKIEPALAHRRALEHRR